MEQKKYSKLPELLDRNKFSPLKISFIIVLHLLTIGTITFFTSGYSFKSIPECELNDIAHEDIISPEDFEVKDMVLTAERKEKARKSVLPLYDFDPDVAARTEKSIRQAFEKVRQILKEK